MTALRAHPWAGGRYQPLALLGRGSSGLVYRVLDRENDVTVALKTLVELDSEGIYRLKQEFRACAGIRHRNLVQLYELHVAGDECFFTMEFVDGVEFVRYVRGTDPGSRGAPLIRFISAARQLIDGLAALHAAGRLHRDVKPPNCLVDRGGRAVLLDFGFMIPFGGRILAVERSETVAGSLAYMAPEVLWGEPSTPASDWYSVGVVFYEALCGELPFNGRAAHLLSRDARPQPARLGREVPDSLAELITSLLDTDPRRRPDARQVASVIESCSAEQRTSTPPVPLADETPFVGRAAELALMDDTLAKLRSDGTSILHVCGPSGIGKSELVRQFLSTIERSGDVVALRGRCHPYETVPYRAFDGVVDALSHYLSDQSETAVAGLVPRHAGAMVRLFPVLGRLPLFAEWVARDDSEDAIELRRRGFAGIRELLARLADRQRLVLWIDDIQWADPDSAALAREVFGGADPPSVLLILTHRSEDQATAAAFTAFEAREGARSIGAVTITLGPLDDADVSALAEHIGRGRVVDVASVVQEAGGSPFFVAQLVRLSLRSTHSRHDIRCEPERDAHRPL